MQLLQQSPVTLVVLSRQLRFWGVQRQEQCSGHEILDKLLQLCQLHVHRTQRLLASFCGDGSALASVELWGGCADRDHLLVSLRVRTVALELLQLLILRSATVAAVGAALLRIPTHLQSAGLPLDDHRMHCHQQMPRLLVNECASLTEGVMLVLFVVLWQPLPNQV
eukprot:2928280-Prymnesium_polylepis.2